MQTDEVLLNRKQLAARLTVPASSIKNLHLPTRQLGPKTFRWSWSEVCRYLESKDAQPSTAAK
jgi:hypothetical protein